MEGNVIFWVPRTKWRRQFFLSCVQYMLSLLPPGRSAKYCNQRVCLSLCLFVCPISRQGNRRRQTSPPPDATRHSIESFAASCGRVDIVQTGGDGSLVDDTASEPLAIRWRICSGTSQLPMKIVWSVTHRPALL